MRRIVKFVGVALALGLLGWIAFYGAFLASALPNGTGLAAKHLCSLHYVSGLPVQRARELYIDPFVQPLTNFLEISTDRKAQTLTAVGFGIVTSVAQLAGAAEQRVIVRLGASTTDPRVRALVKNVISARRS